MEPQSSPAQTIDDSSRLIQLPIICIYIYQSILAILSLSLYIYIYVRVCEK
ncbi:hypothetical protein LguiA_025376 [Lonicera macranthoides]